MSTQVILLERVEKLGNMGDVVTVKPGYARNYLLPRKKALRASKDNIAYFEAQKKHLEAENDKRRSEAEKLAKKIEGTKVSVIRQASESGQLFGSVTSRDITAGVSEETGVEVARSMVSLNDNFKQIGLFPVEIFLHPEVKVEATVNIARTAEEAEIQAKTGKALIADEQQEEEQAEEAQSEATTDVPDEDALKDVLEEGALEAEKERQAEAEEKAAEDAAKAEERAAKKAEKEAAKAAEEAAAAEAEAAEGADAEDASEEPAEEEGEEKAE